MTKTVSLSGEPPSPGSIQVGSKRDHPFKVHSTNSPLSDGIFKQAKIGDLRVTEIQNGLSGLSLTQCYELDLQSDAIIMVLPSQGTCHVKQMNRDVDIGFGEAVVLRSTSPFHLSCNKDFAHFSLQLPCSKIASRVSNINTIYGHPLKLNNRACNLIQQLLRSLIESDQQDDSSAELDYKVAGYVVDLALSSMEDEFNISTQSSGSEHQQQLRKQICSYILDNLENPLMDLASIARDNNLSVSYLHKLFKAENISVTRWVLLKRLERAHEKLLCSSQRHLNISRIAFTCGFNSLPHFSTRFKDHFGVSPRKLRMTHNNSYEN